MFGWIWVRFGEGIDEKGSFGKSQHRLNSALTLTHMTSAYIVKDINLHEGLNLGLKLDLWVSFWLSIVYRFR